MSMSIYTLRNKILSGQLTAEHVTGRALENIRKNADVNAFINVFDEDALEEARNIDKKIAAGESVGPLAGIPVAIKDNIAVKDRPMTCASAFLRDFVSPYDATVAKRLRGAGAIIIGKTNMDEFAMGAANLNSAFGAVKNPLDKTRVSGGSSGGSAAAVSMDMCAAALGTDTGGSVRQPSAFCGVVGLKPTYSSVSRFGLTAFASSLDQIGPVTGNVRDNALIFSIIAGKDGKDSTAADVKYDSQVTPVLKGRKIGVIREQLRAPTLSREVADDFEGALKILSDAGAEIEYYDMPSFDAGIAAYFAISCAEATTNLARFDGIRYGRRAAGDSYAEICARSRGEGFGREVKLRLMTGAYVLSGENYEKYYVKALKVRAAIAAALNDILKDCDFIAGPTSPVKPPRADFSAATLKQKYYGDMYTVIANLAGNPSLSVPCGAGKLPSGLLFTGRMFDESTLFSAAYAFEKERKKCLHLKCE